MFFTILTGANPFDTVSKPIIELLNMALTPALGIVGALGAIYCIILGAKLAKAEEPQDREKAKNSLKNAIVGFVLIFSAAERACFVGASPCRSGRTYGWIRLVISVYLSIDR